MKKVDIDARNAQLFLDDAIIEQTVWLERIIHQPVKYHGNPVYTVGAPWEGTGMVYLGGVYIDPSDGLWKAWYVTYIPPERPEIDFAICLITSRDGVNWERPALDVYRSRDNQPTNIVLDLSPIGRTAGPTILYEPENAVTPWTMLISTAGQEVGPYRAYILRSADGVHWEWERRIPDGVVHGMHDRCTAMKGPDPEYPYVLFSRGVADIDRWGLVRPAHSAATDGERMDGAPTRVVVPDLEDDPEKQVYHAHAFPYEGIYIGLVQWYHEANDPCGEMELITSRDAVNWQRLRPRRPFLSPSPGGSPVGVFDSRIVDTALSPPVRKDKALWFYYWGGQAMHGNRHLSWGRAMGLAQLRIDGFCSLRACRFPGTIVTRPFVWPGGRLLVNSSVLGGSGSGSLHTEVLTEDLQPIPGLTRAEADPIAHVDQAREQTWANDPQAIAKASGQPIRLKFYLDNIDLFSFRAAQPTTD